MRWEKTGAYRYPFRRERKRGHFSAPGALPAPPAAGARALPLPRSRARHCAQYPRASALPAPRRVLPGQSGPGAASLPRGTPAEGEGWSGQPETTRRTASRSKSWRLEAMKTRAIANFTPFTAGVASRRPLPLGEAHRGTAESPGCVPAGTGGLLRGRAAPPPPGPGPPALGDGKERRPKAGQKGLQAWAAAGDLLPRLRSAVSCGHLELASGGCRPGGPGKRFPWAGEPVGSFGVTAGVGVPPHPGAGGKRRYLRPAFPRRFTDTEVRACEVPSPLPVNWDVLIV